MVYYNSKIGFGERGYIFRVVVPGICPRAGQIRNKIRHSGYSRWLIFRSHHHYYCWRYDWYQD